MILVKRRCLLIAVAAAMAAVAGCGGGSGETTTALTRAQFIKRGDEICKQAAYGYSKRLSDLAKLAPNEKLGPKAEEDTFKAAIPPIKKAAAELDELPPPRGDEPQAEAIVKALEDAVGQIEGGEIKELSGPNSPFAEFDKLTAKYGFTYCKGY